MFCTSCGKIINDDSEFCSYCGSKVKPLKPAMPAESAADESSEGGDTGDSRVEFLDLTHSESGESEPEQSLQTDELPQDTSFESGEALVAADEGPVPLSIDHQNSSSSTKTNEVSNQESYRTFYVNPDKTKRHAHRAERGHQRLRKPVSGMTKAALALLVLWTAVFGIILVRHTLTAQNAREAARTTAKAGKEDSAGGSTVSQEAGSSLEQTEASAGASSSVPPEEPAQENLTFKCLFKNATGWDQINLVTAFLSPGRDAPTSDPAYQLELTQDGYAVSDAAEGDYTLSWQAEGYYDGYVNVTIGKSVLTMEKNLIPVLTDLKNCTIMLEWNGDRDLDLVLFDAHTQQYLNILYPVNGGNFLFEDTGSNRRCEVIRIADCTLPQVYTVYVRDDNLLRNIASENTISMMERDGVSITVATAAGIIAYKTANPGSTSALWSPLYVYEGNAYPLDNYITDYAQDAWAFYDKTVK